MAVKALVDKKDSMLGQSIGHYKIISQLGAGGMGEVYLAKDTKLDRRVALKILPSELAADRNRMQRFVQEAKAASALNHRTFSPFTRLAKLTISVLSPLNLSTVRHYVSDEAVKWLRTTAETGMPNYPLFARDPHLDRIRKDTAFIQFMTDFKTRWDGYKEEFE